MKPNILVIMSDQHTPSVLGCYGNKDVLTPNLDALSENGVTFDNAYCNNPVCVPSRMSMLTGMHSHAIDVWHNGDALPPQLATWPLSLRLEGYETVISGRNHMLWGDRLGGFSRRLCGDYGTVVPALKPGRTRQGSGLPQGIKGTLGPVEDSKNIRLDEEACREAEAYLEDTHKDPFALFVGLYNPHAPFTVPQKYYDMYKDFEPELHRDEVIEPMYKEFTDARGLDKDILLDAIKTYYAMVSYVDDFVGRLMKSLEKSGQLENTIVVYTSDHGEMLSRHGMWHKMCFYEDSVRVPMIVMNQKRFSTGTHVSENISLLDLFPTFMDWAQHSTDLPLDGESFNAALTDSSWQRTHAVIAESIGVKRSQPGLMVKQGHYKLIHYHDTPDVLFDLKSDPMEHINKAEDPAYAEIMKSLVSKIPADWDPEDINTTVDANLKHLYYHNLVGIQDQK